jgi:hypothetical protein
MAELVDEFSVGTSLATLPEGYPKVLAARLPATK